MFFSDNFLALIKKEKKMPVQIPVEIFMGAVAIILALISFFGKNMYDDIKVQKKEMAEFKYNYLNRFDGIKNDIRELKDVMVDKLDNNFVTKEFCKQFHKENADAIDNLKDNLAELKENA